MILQFLAPVLGEFKWYRKKVGGTWYKVYDFNSDLGMAGDTVHWTDEKPVPEVEILEQEDYE